MTQYNELMKRKAKELEAEEWGNQIKYMHAQNGVLEIVFNNGVVQFEETKPGGKKWTEGEAETKESLFYSFGRWIADQRGK